jgi:hypothetical protein
VKKGKPHLNIKTSSKINRVCHKPHFLSKTPFLPRSIYYIEKKANVVGVGTDIKFKIFSGKLLDVAPKSRLADGLMTDFSRWSGCDFVDCKDG